MTEPAPTDAELELASAYADGEVSPEEADAVEADPRVRALATRLGGVRARLAVDPPAPGLVDAHVAAAMAAFDDREGARVVDLAERRPWYRSVPLGAAAAVLAVVALVGAFAVSATDDGGDQLATNAADDSADAFEATGDDAGGATLESDAADLAPAITAERPEFADLDAFVSHLDELTSGSDARTTEDAAPTAGAGEGAGGEADAPTAADGSACDPVGLAGVSDAVVIAVVEAVVSGRDVTAVVVDDGGRRAVIVDVVVCEVVEERSF